MPDRPGRRSGRPPRTISQILQGVMTKVLDSKTEGEAQGRLERRSPWELANEQRSLISQILELNRRQHELATGRESTLQRWRMAQRAPPRVVIVSNRLPISVKRGSDGQLEFSVSSGGMVSALLGVQHMRMVWVGWCELEDATAEEMQMVRRHMLRRGCVPIFLEPKVARGYYNGFCNDVLWPLFHYVSRSPDEEGTGAMEQQQWQAYCKANAKFAETVAAVARSEDVVWVHDYHLMLLPSLLRQLLPRLKIGWFLHTPWPSSEVFRMLPVRREILRGQRVAGPSPPCLRAAPRRPPWPPRPACTPSGRPRPRLRPPARRLHRLEARRGLRSPPRAAPKDEAASALCSGQARPAGGRPARLPRVRVRAPLLARLHASARQRSLAQGRTSQVGAARGS